MSETDIWVILGVAIATIGAIGGLIVRDRNLHEHIDDGDDRLHARIDDLKDNYVRRDDLAAHVTRIERTVDEVKTDVRDMRVTHEIVMSSVKANNELLRGIAESIHAQFSAHQADQS